MKKAVLLFLLGVVPALYVCGQTKLAEPPRANDVYLLYEDGTTAKLDKSPLLTTTKAGPGAYLLGVGKVRLDMHVEGRSASVRANIAQRVRFIFNSGDNTADPESVVALFKLNPKGKNRKANLSAVDTYRGSLEDNLQYVPFKAGRYGESSYIIEPTDVEAGEYGIMVVNPAGKDKVQVVNTYGIDAQ